MDAVAPPKKSLPRTILTSLTFWIIVGAILGIILGAFAPTFSVKAAPMAQLFLRPIQFIVFPLVFSSLVVGIANQNDMKQLGRVAIKSIIYFEIVTTIAMIVGLLAANIVKPGSVGLVEGEAYTSSTSTLTFATFIQHLTPKTWGEMMGGSGSSELLQVLVASVLVGVSTAYIHDESKRLIVEFARAVLEMMFKFVNIVIWTAPVGVCFAVANSIGKNGVSSLSSLGALVATTYGALVVIFFVIFVPIFVYFKINIPEFFVAMREPLAIGFTTASSEAALPKVFECLEEYGVSPHVLAFVVPFGYSFNLDAGAMNLALCSLFCAQAAGIHKTVGEQIVMALMMMVSSKGIAGVRSANIVVLASTITQLDIPSWPVALILGVDWLSDMARTFINITGNCLAATVMAKLENEFRTDEWKHKRHVQEETLDHLDKESVSLPSTT
ncbi:Dicarboxylate/amino acid:cation (Na or H) symporter (DAACS) family protein [Phytophthora palmivora]|uniref:Amino acid transporter n=1 Tax=Phytophthora palmivora TaxID=4796 RepID=A0A2P4X737_9STRA|nr:Dicarboxylate/amino acid:cation (Na or H) symporter (DAACS) family protein [Phytophthora palmivora]